IDAHIKGERMVYDGSCGNTKDRPGAVVFSRGRTEDGATNDNQTASREIEEEFSAATPARSKARANTSLEKVFRRTMVTDSKQGGEGEDQDDGDGNERRKNVLRITVVNYFFTNFPPEWNEGNLRELFAEIEEVADVYVARKLSKVGLRFGFAHFFQVGNAQVLEKRLNKIWYGTFKLRANVAKFERSFSKFRQGCKKM
ncbi:nucleotide-binding alpha-beta plait domain-containing protein, partial [Tanacetum coccineum]